MPVPHLDDEELLIEVSDDDSEIIGSVARKRVHNNPSIIHRAVHIVILNDEGLMLLQKRSMTKDIMPGRWDTSVGGHVGWGQTYEEAAVREAEEELGVHIDPEKLEYLYLLKIRDPVESENIRSYFHRHSGPFKPGADEVEAVRFWSRTEIQDTLGTGKFTPNFEIEYSAFMNSPYATLLN